MGRCEVGCRKQKQTRWLCRRRQPRDGERLIFCSCAMSSFKRKTTTKQAALPPGTRACPGSPLTTLTSTGIPSLDDVLGGGLPLSCVLAVLAPDAHSAYGELVQRYFVAQALAVRHRVLVVDGEAEARVRECMWLPRDAVAAATVAQAGDREDEDVPAQGGEKIRIAWRYEQMKKFRTTVSASHGVCEFTWGSFTLSGMLKPWVRRRTSTARRLT